MKYRRSRLDSFNVSRLRVYTAIIHISAEYDKPFFYKTDEYVLFRGISRSLIMIIKNWLSFAIWAHRVVFNPTLASPGAYPLHKLTELF